MNKTQAKAKSKAWNSEFGPVCCGRIVAFDSERHPVVEFPGNPGEPVAARWLDSVCLDERHLSENATLLLAFEHGDPARPIVVGLVESAFSPASEKDESVQKNSSRHALVDGRRVTIRGNDEVTLVCGKASITLTKDGRINLRGVEITSRASGANKIRGASVNIN
ncbi:MAG: DUF6484 domain-containing protein [Chthoniobacteraceae bacterium]